MEIVDWRDRQAVEWLRRCTPDLACRSCGVGIPLPTPVLVLRPGDPVPALAGFPWKSSPEDDVAALRRLAGHPEVPAVSPLPIAMADLAAVASRYSGLVLAGVGPQWSGRERLWMEAIQPQVTVPDLRAGLAAFITSGGGTAGDELARQHPGLLDAAWLPVVEELIARTIAEQQDPEAAGAVRRAGIGLSRLRNDTVGGDGDGLDDLTGALLEQATSHNGSPGPDHVEVLWELAGRLRSFPEHQVLLAGTLISFIATASTPPWRTPDTLRRAISVGPETIALSEKVFGPGSARTLTAKQDFAAAILDHQQGSPAENEQTAMRLFAEIAGQAVESVSPLLPDVLQNWAAAFSHHLPNGRTDNQQLALRLFQDAIHVQQVLRPHDRRGSLIMRLNTAAMLRESRTGNVLAATRVAVTVYRDSLYQPESIALLSAAQLAQGWANMTNALFQLHRLAPREAGLNEIADVAGQAAAMAEAVEPGDPVRIRALSNVGGVLGDLYQQSYRDGVPRTELLDEGIRLTGISYADAKRWLPEAHDELIRAGANHVATLMRPHDGRIPDADRAERILLELLGTARQQNLPTHSYTIARNLGQLLATQGRWPESARLFEVSLDSVQQLFADARTPASRLAELGIASDLAGWLAVTHLRAMNVPGAINALERSRARMLSNNGGSVVEPHDRPVLYAGVGVLGSWVILSRSGGRSPLGLRMPLEAAEVRPLVAAVRLARTVPDLTAALDALVTILRPAILQPVQMILEEEHIEDIDVVTSGLISGLPLHALPAGQNGDCWLDLAAIRYIPSRGAAQRWAAQHRPPRTESVLGLADTMGDLDCARHELAMIPAAFGTLIDVPPAGDRRSWLSRHLQTATHAHFACHAEWNPDDPLLSHLKLGGHHQLTLAQLLELNCEHLDMAILSCCSTGFSAESLSDELLGFGTGFLLAGARRVVVSNWDLDDLASSLVMARFYQLLQAGGDAGMALRSAQLWVAALTVADLRQMRSEALSGAPDAFLPDGIAAEISVAAQPSGDRPFGHPAYWGGLSYFGPAKDHQ